MNDTEIGLLIGLCVAGVIIFIMVFLFISMRKVSPDSYHQNQPIYHHDLPVPRYVRATRKLPETRKKPTRYADSELKADYPVR